MKTSFSTVFFIFIIISLLYGCISQSKRPLEFVPEIIDNDAKGRTAIGDMDMDDYPDIVVHTWGTERGIISDGTLTVFLYPGWRKIEVRKNADFFGDDVIIYDINHDGFNDLVTCRGSDYSAQLWWYENPGGDFKDPWPERMIALIEEESEVKDIAVYDMDDDGLGDIVARTKHYTVIYFQETDNGWEENRMKTTQREGMTIGDVDDDGDYDIVLNGYWLENPDKPRESAWQKYIIDDMWYTDTTGGWQDFSVRVVVEDIDGDNETDVVFSQSEKPDYPIIWYKSTNPSGGEGSWVQHEVGVVHYCHSLEVADFDLDGDMDIVAGTLSRLDNPELILFLNLDESGTTWARTRIDTLPVYKIAVGDIDNDGDFDITSSYNWETPPLRLWRNVIVDGR
ncbi:MAG: hypothetical protein AMS27_07385 [Bacteroides sp. SM23_62_1]|nr:MAG: hypothetical protein AMS27_07385 [Bacteroides sp. SM23_62_1]